MAEEKSGQEKLADKRWFGRGIGWSDKKEPSMKDLEKKFARKRAEKKEDKGSPVLDAYKGLWKMVTGGEKREKVAAQNKKTMTQAKINRLSQIARQTKNKKLMKKVARLRALFKKKHE